MTDLVVIEKMEKKWIELVCVNLSLLFFDLKGTGKVKISLIWLDDGNPREKPWKSVLRNFNFATEQIIAVHFYHYRPNF